MNRKIEDFEKELKFILSSNIFFRKPSDTKVVVYSLLYFVLTILITKLDLHTLLSIVTLPLLVYVLAAKKLQYFIPVSLLTLLSTYLLSSYDALVWTFIHIVLAIIICNSIRKRYSKILVLLYTSSFMFFALTVYIAILIKLSVITYSPQGIQAFIDAYIADVMAIQGNQDAEILRQGFEQLKIYFPTIIYGVVLVYSLVLNNFTFSFLSREKAIVPVFPKLKLLAVSRSFSYLYLIIILIVLLISLTVNDTYNQYYLFFDNIYALMRWIFVFNGICMLFYFIELNEKSSGRFLKFLTVISAYMFSGIFDIIGLIDSLFRVREHHARLKGRE